MDQYVGIDVSSDKLDVGVAGEPKGLQVANSKQGIKKLLTILRERKPCLIVVEATGGYEEAVVQALFEAGLPRHPTMMKDAPPKAARISSARVR